jgi:DNA-binding Lrp family transcriptional regulator
MKLDRIDVDILNALQRNAHVKAVELAEGLGISPSPLYRRIRLLEQAGVITNYATLLSQEKVGLPVSAYVSVALEKSAEKLAAFERAILGCENSLQRYLRFVFAENVTWSCRLPRLGRKACLHRAMGIQSVHGSHSAPPSSGIIMRSQIKVAPHTAGNGSEYGLSRQAQALALEQADSARAENRRVNDALIDSNASKWRYSAALAKS